MIDAYCNKCRITFTFTSTQERTEWTKRHPNHHRVEGAK